MSSTNILKYDIVIIGGGPAGASCGITLQKYGKNVCIVDSHSFPRHKLCGGGITQKTMNLLTDLIDKERLNSIICNKTNQVKLFSKKDELVSSEISDFIYFTDRYNFDSALIEEFKIAGGNLLENRKVVSINKLKNQITLNDNTIIEYNTLIGADGAKSMVRKSIDKELQSIGFCMEIDIPKANLPEKQSAACVYFNIIDKGYGWVFPKQDSYTIGLGNVFIKGTDYKKTLTDFLDLLGADYNEKNIKGAYLPFGRYLKKPYYKDNIFLIGDAAGFVDAIYGEGLYFGIDSGIKIAQIINENFTDLEKLYKTTMKKSFQILRGSYFYHKIFYNRISLRLFPGIVKGHNNFVKFFVDNMLSHYNYSYHSILLMPFYYFRQKKKNQNH